MSVLNPEPRTLIPLPPTPRDFEIHRLHLVHHMSTRRLAEKYEVSQTRVRQIIKAVSQWLVTTMPVKTEAEQEQETRLAQHLAADQLKHQIELLQSYFDGSGDPKYLRQQTRVILALARLGVIPGSIEAHAADAEESSRHRGTHEVGRCALTPHQPEASARDYDLVTRVPPGHAPTRGSSLAEPPTSATSTNPPHGDCSPSANATPSETPAPECDSATTPLHETPSPQIYFPDEEQLEGLCYFENRLLTLLDNTAPNNKERLESLQETLAEVRHQKATVELRLSPKNRGAEITTDLPPYQSSTATANCQMSTAK